MSNEPERDAVRRERRRLEELMAEYNAILDEEPALVSARDRLQEIQHECLAILARHPAPEDGQP
jgi:hypothetical protein